MKRILLFVALCALSACDDTLPGRIWLDKRLVCAGTAVNVSWNVTSPLAAVRIFAPDDTLLSTAHNGSLMHQPMASGSYRIRIDGREDRVPVEVQIGDRERRVQVAVSCPMVGANTVTGSTVQPGDPRLAVTSARQTGGFSPARDSLRVAGPGGLVVHLFGMAGTTFPESDFTGLWTLSASLMGTEARCTPPSPPGLTSPPDVLDVTMMTHCR